MFTVVGMSFPLGSTTLNVGFITVLSTAKLLLALADIEISAFFSTVAVVCTPVA